jgi:hypothetical protein
MKRTARLAVCAVAALALAGVGTDAQARGTHDHGRHHAQVERDGNTHVLRALGRLDRRLVQATRTPRLAPLTDADRAALRTNAATDEATVEAAATAYAYRPSARTFTDARTVLATFHHGRYVAATRILSRAAAVEAAVTELQPRVRSGSPDAAALTRASELLAAVEARDFRATTDRAAITAARRAVAQARALVGQVRADLDTVGQDAPPTSL